MFRRTPRAITHGAFVLSLLSLLLAAMPLAAAEKLGAEKSGADQVGNQQAGNEPAPGDYRIVNGRVDNGTYTGWRLFHTTCYGCHGVDARGTDLAPNLVDRIKALTPREFATKVLTSYRLMQPEGKANAGPEEREEALQALIERVLKQDRSASGQMQMQMPAWQDNPRVRPHVLDLYAYLTARADGKLKPGEPRRIEESPTR